MQEHLNTYCKGCDQFSAPHRRRDDGQWVCEDCDHLVECSNPQWSDNCDGDLTTPHEVKKGLCEGCMAVIDSWSDDGEGDNGPEQTKLMTDGGVRMQGICDEFVREHAVPADSAESWVHIGIDDHYHPAGGFWFPTGEKWGDSSGWVSRKYDIPHGDVIQYPCSEKKPEIRGKDSLPDYVVNRTMDVDGEQDG